MKHIFYKNKLKNIKEFIFIHNTASNGIIFSIEEMEKNLILINKIY